jgi:hypothetical protein
LAKIVPAGHPPERISAAIQGGITKFCCDVPSITFRRRLEEQYRILNINLYPQLLTKTFLTISDVLYI